MHDSLDATCLPPNASSSALAEALALAWKEFNNERSASPLSFTSSLLTHTLGPAASAALCVHHTSQMRVPSGESSICFRFCLSVFEGSLKEVFITASYTRQHRLHPVRCSLLNTRYHSNLFLPSSPPPIVSPTSNLPRALTRNCSSLSNSPLTSSLSLSVFEFLSF